MTRSHVVARATVSALLAGIVLLTGCNREDPLAEQAPAAEPKNGEESTPTPTALAPKAYQRALNEATDDLRVRLTELSKADDPAELGKRLEQASVAAAAAAEELRPLTVPEEAAAAHDHLLTALDQLGADLGAVNAAVRDRQVCTTRAALADLGTSDAYASLPEARAALAELGYTVRLGNLKTPEPQTRRLPNGTLIRDPGSDSPGTLNIDNGGDTDAVITLASGKDPVLTIYVHKGKQASTDGVPDGTYTVFFSTGEDWDGKAMSFTRGCQFQKFDDQVTFTTTGGTYSVNSLTLHQVIGGNASTSEIDPSEFPG